jgi:hypothetical protein
MKAPVETDSFIYTLLLVSFMLAHKILIDHPPSVPFQEECCDASALRKNQSESTHFPHLA